jgi:preprotein translocase subunit SecG
MASEGSTQKGLIGIVLLLIVILVVGFVLWQRDQDSQDLNIEIGAEDAEAVVEPGPTFARGLPEGIGLSVV